MHRIGTRLALTCSLVLLSACSERVSFLAPKFQMGSNNAQALVVTPDGEVHESGKLTVSIRGFLDTLTKKRRLLATLSDVEKVVVEVSASGLSFSQTIAKADITSGTTTATFTGIPEGAATVTMKAYNLSNQLIGQASKATAVTAGATTTVEIQLQLDPTYTQPSSGGGSTSTGSITANGTIIDGPVIEGTPPPPSGTVIGTYQLDYAPNDLAVDAVGDVWITNRTDSKLQLLSKLSGDGTLIGHYDGLYGSMWGSNIVAIAPDGNVWVGGSTGLVKYSSSGQILASGGGDLGYNAIAFTPDGGAWVQWYNLGTYSIETEKVASDCTSVSHLSYSLDPSMPPTGQEIDIATDSQGNLWVIGYTAPDPMTSFDGYSSLTRFSPTGQQLVYSFPGASGPERLVVDASDHVWVALREAKAVAKVAPDGTTLGTFAVGGTPENLAVDPSGNLWIATGVDVVKMSSVGAVVGRISIPDVVPLGIAAGSSGIWVTDGGTTPKVTRLAL